MILAEMIASTVQVDPYLPAAMFKASNSSLDSYGKNVVFAAERTDKKGKRRYKAGRNHAADLALLRSGGLPPEFRRVDDYHFQCRWGSLWPKPVTAVRTGYDMGHLFSCCFFAL